MQGKLLGKLFKFYNTWKRTFPLIISNYEIKQAFLKNLIYFLNINIQIKGPKENNYYEQKVYYNEMT